MANHNLEFNKIAAAILLAGVLAMVSGTISKAVFGGYAHHHEGEEEHRGFKVEGAEVTEGGEAPKEVDIGTALAAATVEQGAAVVKKCLACHDFSKGGPNKVGPNLWGVLGGPHAHKSDFQYSEAMKATHGETWTPENIWHFLNNPAAYIKGTKMAFAGLKKPEELAAAIKYLNANTDSPVALPAPKAGAEAAPEGKADKAAADVKKASPAEKATGKAEEKPLEGSKANAAKNEEKTPAQKAAVKREAEQGTQSPGATDTNSGGKNSGSR